MRVPPAPAGLTISTALACLAFPRKDLHPVRGHLAVTSLFCLGALAIANVHFLSLCPRPICVVVSLFMEPSRIHPLPTPLGLRTVLFEDYSCVLGSAGPPQVLVVDKLSGGPGGQPGVQQAL